MKLNVEHASGEWPKEATWDCETVHELLDKIRDCGREVILDKDGNVVIYDGRLE